MKLWQKIFLLTLAFVIIVVNASSLALLSNNHYLAIEREQQNALARHNALSFEIRSYISYTRLYERKMSLTEEEALTVARNVLLDRQQNDTSMKVSLYKDHDLIYPLTYQDGLPVTIDLLNESDFSSVIEEHNDKTLLYIVSTVSLSDQPYQLVTSVDISSTYEYFRIDFNQIRFVGIISALIVSGILLLLVRGLLNPLRSLSTTTSLIANGDLNKRATVKGHDEVAEVARSLNTMADSIENNVTALEELAESRKIFISNLAHEMKTPLTSILGFADILRVKREVSDEERIEYANVIVSETKRLKELSSKLMELLSVGNLQTTLQLVEVHKFATELTTALMPIVQSHTQKLKAELPGEPVFIRVDKELMKSFISNLVDNSVKASHPGDTIRFIIEVVADSIETNRMPDASSDTSAEADIIDGMNSGFDTATTTIVSDQIEAIELVKITVMDEGIGIPADEIPLIVEPFYMLDKARTRRHGGAGLGLALCSEIARAHNTELVIKSIVGRGTAVSILLKKEKGDD